LRWPGGKWITINLAPADVRKEGPTFDLPIAMAMLKLEENNRLPDLHGFCISAELASSDKSKRKRWASVGCGYFPIAIAGRRERIF
jgi:magnesium chelatase family protein